MMNGIDKVAQTSLIIAYWRMRETEKPDPLFSDHLAHLFLDSAATDMAQRFTSLSPSTEVLVQFRTRYFDEQIARQAAAGVKQVVLLGAGLDTRAIRFGLPGVSFYELDQPNLIEYKRRRLEESGYFLNSRLIPCASAAGSSGRTSRPSWPSVTISSTTGMLLATGGTPTCIASSSGRPKPS